MLYYADGGPGPATKLLRVDAPKDGPRDFWRWRARGERWSPNGGHWFEYPAQEEILISGELFLVDDSQVPEIQAQMTAEYKRYAQLQE